MVLVLLTDSLNSDGLTCVLLWHSLVLASAFLIFSSSSSIYLHHLTPLPDDVNSSSVDLPKKPEPLNGDPLGAGLVDSGNVLLLAPVLPLTLVLLHCFLLD